MKEGACRGVDESKRTRSAAEKGTLSATKMSVGASGIAQHVHEGRQKSSRYRKERQCNGKVAGDSESAAS